MYIYIFNKYVYIYIYILYYQYQYMFLFSVCKVQSSQDNFCAVWSSLWCIWLLVYFLVLWSSSCACCLAEDERSFAVSCSAVISSCL